MFETTIQCDNCNKKLEKKDAYKCIQDDLGHKVCWCSQKCFEEGLKSKGLGETK